MNYRGHLSWHVCVVAACWSDGEMVYRIPVPVCCCMVVVLWLTCSLLKCIQQPHGTCSDYVHAPLSSWDAVSHMLTCKFTITQHGT